LEVPIETVYYTLRFAHDRGIRTILNPAPAQSLDLKSAGLANYVIPNETEAATISGLPVHDLESARTCARHLIGGGLRCVIITLGEKGAWFASAEKEFHVPAFEVRPVDTTGAGDAFIGSFAYFIATGLPEVQAVRRANLYAALSTLATGTQKSFSTGDQWNAEWKSRTGETL
jgi:ribokinase